VISYKDNKLVLTESSIRDLDEIFLYVNKDKLSGEILVDFLEIKSYVSEIVDKLNNEN
jgi:hypothetical protein